MAPVPDHGRRQQDERGDEASRQVAAIQFVIIDKKLDGLQQYMVAEGHAAETRSIADFIQRMNEVAFLAITNNDDDAPVEEAQGMLQVVSPPN